MNIHLIDGTYELFRHFYGGLKAGAGGHPLAAARGVVGMTLQMLEGGALHLGIATDHVIESFRNRLWSGYKTGDGLDPALLSQFEPLEEALDALGVAVWPMVELEADDALASAAHIAAQDPEVERVCIWTPDKDLAQCVQDDRVVQVDRRTGAVRNAEGVRAKFGVAPESIPDYLALVGDSADGYPGLPGWGGRSAAIVLDHYLHLEAIPERAANWEVNVRNAGQLASTLVANRALVLLFRKLATLRTDAPLFESVSELRWRAPKPAFEAIAERLGAPGLAVRAQELAASAPVAASGT
jgi:5'-3' exonuclease